MKKQVITYETLLKITSAISATRDPEEVVVLTVESVKAAMDVKGCTLFLIDRKTEELKIAGSYGLSQNYLDKGPVSSLTSIAAVSYTHLTLPTMRLRCSSRWSPDH